MLEQLPSHGRYKAAILDDEELAERIAEQPASSSFGMHEWTPERALLTVMVDWLQAIYSITVAANSKNGKGPPVKPLPRPVTAVDRLEQRRRLEMGRAIMAQMFPDLYG
jgi:hypothetical protein